MRISCYHCISASSRWRLAALARRPTGRGSELGARDTGDAHLLSRPSRAAHPSGASAAPTNLIGAALQPAQRAHNLSLVWSYRALGFKKLPLFALQIWANRAAQPIRVWLSLALQLPPPPLTRLASICGALSRDELVRANIIISLVEFANELEGGH